MKKIFIIASLLLVSLAGMAQDKQPVYKSSFFGIRSDGVTDNTNSIRKAQDVTISGKGVIDGRGPGLLRNIFEQTNMKHIPDDIAIPTLVYLKDCQNVSLKDFILRYPATKNSLYIIEGGDVKVEGCYSDTR